MSANSLSEGDILSITWNDTPVDDIVRVSKIVGDHMIVQYYDHNTNKLTEATEDLELDGSSFSMSYKYNFFVVVLDILFYLCLNLLF